MKARNNPRKAVHSLESEPSRATWRRVKAFSLSAEDEGLIDLLQHRLSMTGRLVSESETVRAALRALEMVPEGELEGLLQRVPKRKPGPGRR